MKFLADQDVYAATVLFLRQLGHEVETASERGLSQADDADLLRAAGAEGRVFVTRDRDYGGLVFVQELGAGVLYLRILPSTVQAVHAELGRVLTLYGEADLLGTFVVVEPGRHRVRRPASGGGESA
ncbi:MAG TPA: DUF5615 family PIN-like protein [Planctomycetaceae bacterium]|nr:DUF5615 family PIN-like protein [Planctomycetaceae bacterium]